MLPSCSVKMSGMWGNCLTVPPVVLKTWYVYFMFLSAVWLMLSIKCLPHRISYWVGISVALLHAHTGYYDIQSPDI